MSRAIDCLDDHEVIAAKKVGICHLLGQTCAQHHSIIASRAVVSKVKWQGIC